MIMRMDADHNPVSAGGVGAAASGCARVADAWAARRVIRPATEADVELILSFIRELAHYEKLSQEVSADMTSLRETLFGERRYAEVLICLNDGQAVGFALFFTNYSTFLAKPGIWLEDLFVRPAARDRGNGRALLRAVARVAVERGAGRIEWAVLDWNRPALGFYKKLGAKPLRDWIIHRVTGSRLNLLAE